MNFLVAVLVDFICKDNNLTDEDYKIYQYGLRAGLEMACCLLACLAIAVRMGMFQEYIMFFAIFISARSYVGGIHMKSYWQCFILSCGVFVSVLYLAKYFVLGSLTALLLILASICIICGFEYSGKFDGRASREELIFYRKKMNFIFGIWIIVFIAFAIFRLNSLLTLSAYAFWGIMLSKIAGIAKDRMHK